MICPASVFGAAAETGLTGAWLRRTAAARATGTTNARAPKWGVRNGAPSYQRVVMGHDGDDNERRAHGRTIRFEVTDLAWGRRIGSDRRATWGTPGSTRQSRAARALRVVGSLVGLGVGRRRAV